MARRRPNPVAWVLLAVVLLVAVLTVRAAFGGRDTYSGQALSVARSTAALGTEVAALKTQFEELDRTTLMSSLSTWEQAAGDHVAQLEALVPPEDLRRAHAYLLTALGLRADAMRRLSPSISNALSDRDQQVAVSQLLNVMRDLAHSDRSYELFRETWPEARGQTPPESRWLSDPDDASMDGVTAVVRELRRQPALAEEINLSVSIVSVEPKPTGREADVDTLPFTRSLSVSVQVVNTGNQPAAPIPIAAVLTSESDPAPRTAEATVPGLRPGERRSVVLTGLAASPGVMNLLRVSAGPAPGERNLLDNTVEYKFLMRRP